MEELLLSLLKNGGAGGCVAAIAFYFFTRSGRLEEKLEKANTSRIDGLEKALIKCR